MLMLVLLFVHGQVLESMFGDMVNRNELVIYFQKRMGMFI